MRVRGRVQARGVDVDLEVGGGEVLALLGPNGAGKSSVLGMLSGLLVPDEGRVTVGERVLLDTAAGVAVPAHARGVGVLTQDPVLFPHLSVLANVAFGPRCARRSRAAAAAAARDWLAALGVADLADRRPAQLSGGQAQRVGLARALAVEPAVLLLDEPLAALDVEVAAQLRPLLRRVARESGRTTLIVTHDLLDVLALADRVAVLHEGRVVELGSTTEVLRAPRSPFAARLAGVNLVRGRAESAGVRTDSGGVVVGVGEVDPGRAGRGGVRACSRRGVPEPARRQPQKRVAQRHHARDSGGRRRRRGTRARRGRWRRAGERRRHPGRGRRTRPGSRSGGAPGREGPGGCPAPLPLTPAALTWPYQEIGGVVRLVLRRRTRLSGPRRNAAMSAGTRR